MNLDKMNQNTLMQQDTLMQQEENLVVKKWVTFVRGGLGGVRKNVRKNVRQGRRKVKHEKRREGVEKGEQERGNSITKLA